MRAGRINVLWLCITLVLSGLIKGNSFINGKGLTNGHSPGNDRGLINGNGLVNGFRALKADMTNGLTNGNGITNGLGPKRHAIDKKRGKLKRVVVPVAIFILIFTPYATINIIKTPEGIKIDGDFSEWEEVVIYPDTLGDGSPDILGCAVQLSKAHLCFYVETDSNLLRGLGSDGDTLQVFIDTDADPSTGYDIQTLGADCLVEVYGREGRVLSQKTYKYDMNNHTMEERGNHDWNAWDSVSAPNVALKGSKLEAQLWLWPIGIEPNAVPKVLLHLMPASGKEDFSPIISKSGALEVSTRSLLSGHVVDPGIDAEMLEITLDSLGDEPILVEKLVFEQTSTLKAEDIEKAIIRSDDIEIEGSVSDRKIIFDVNKTIIEESYVLSLELSSKAREGDAFNILLTGITTDAGVTFTNQERASAYVSSPPYKPVIDGLFSEWHNPMNDTVGDTPNPNIDLSEYDAMLYQETTHFYLKVVGNVLKGGMVPLTQAIYVPSEEEPSPRESNQTTENPKKTPDSIIEKLPPMVANDTIYIFLDVTPGKGFILNDMHADQMIEIVGRGGKVLSTRHHEFSGTDPTEWNWTAIPERAIDVAASGNEIEAAVSATPSAVYFHVVDWEGNLDSSDEAIYFYLDLEVEEIKELLDSDKEITILDVRTWGEYELGFISDAILIPHTEIVTTFCDSAEHNTPSSSNGTGTQSESKDTEHLARIQKLNKTKPLVVYCGSGKRSAIAGRTLAKNGFRVYNMLGGLKAWRDAGLSIVSNLSGKAYIDGILISGKPVFLVFYTERCDFCQKQMLIVDELEREYRDEIVFMRVKGEENPEMMEEFGTGGYPSMFLITGRGEERKYESQYFRRFTDRETLKENMDYFLSYDSGCGCGDTSTLKPVFLILYADGYDSCQKQMVIIDELEREYKNEIDFVRLNGEEHPKIMDAFKASIYPSMFLILIKKEEGRYKYLPFEGFTDKETLKENIYDLLSNGLMKHAEVEEGWLSLKKKEYFCCQCWDPNTSEYSCKMLEKGLFPGDSYYCWVHCTSNRYYYVVYNAECDETSGKCIPEFSDIQVPLLGTLVIFGILRRKRRKPS